MRYTDEQIEELRRCDNALFTLADQDYNATPMNLPQLTKMRSQSLMKFSITSVEGPIFAHHHDDGVSQIMLKVTTTNSFVATSRTFVVLFYFIFLKNKLKIGMKHVQT